MRSRIYKSNGGKKLIFQILMLFMATFSAPSLGWTQQTTPTLWNHNASTVYLVADGSKRQFIYEEPRSGIAAQGVRQGSLLFDGLTKNGHYSGIAYIFRGGCGSYPYQVSGPILDGYERVVLQGKAPRVGANCQIMAYINDTLEFTLIKSNQASRETQIFSALAEFEGTWGDDPSCSQGVTTTIMRGEISLWHKFVSIGSKANKFYGGCDIQNVRKLSSTQVAADLIECDHPGHKKMNALFEKLSGSSIRTPFGVLYSCR